MGNELIVGLTAGVGVVVGGVVEVVDASGVGVSTPVVVGPGVVEAEGVGESC